MATTSAVADELGQREARELRADREAVVAELLTGLTAGRYLLIDEIGRDARQVVVRVYDIKLQREVSLAILPSTALSDEARAEVLRDTQAVAKLNHANVITIYDAEVAAVAGGEALLIATEFVPGLTLRAWLESRASRVPLDSRSWREVKAVVLAAGRGLAAAHAAGIVHGDFNPERVLVGDDGRVRVVDFGLVSDRTWCDALTAVRSLYLNGNATGEPLAELEAWLAQHS